MTLDHPIFTKSIEIIKGKLGETGLNPLQQDVLERLIHTTGDFSIQSLLKFSPGSCQSALKAIKAGAPILTDTNMAKASIAQMASRTISSQVNCVLDWAPETLNASETRTSHGMKNAWIELSSKFSGSQSPIVLIGSAPTGLETLLDLVSAGCNVPSLIIGMPVGFVGVIQSKERLAKTNLNQIRIDGNRGGSALAGATLNALLRASVYKR